MNELLKKLLEADVLNESTKAELESAIVQHLNESIEVAKATAVAEARAELTETWARERDTLIEAIDTKVNDMLASEVKELKEDIERFRDLEAEYAERLVEAKGAMAENLKKDLGTLVEKLNKFLEIRLASEMKEFREDIEQIKKVQFGRKIVEAFAEEFRTHFATDDSTVGQLREAEEKLAKQATQLESAKKRLAVMEREQKLASVLSPLNGRQRSVMEAILKNVETPLLEEAYSTFIGRVVKETLTESVKPSEKETRVLAEGSKKKTEKKLTEAPKRIVRTGDSQVIVESEATPRLDPAFLASIKRAAGMSN